MSELFYSLAILACPVGMGVMMWFMMRGSKEQPAAMTADEAQLSQMRAEIDQLRAGQASAGTTSPQR
jgi:hypothetical protein